VVHDHICLFAATAAEWLEWLGCDEAAVAALGITREAEAEGVGVGIFR